MKKIFLILTILLLILVVGCTNDLCKQKAKGKGICEGHWTGVQFDETTGKCEFVGISGCNAEFPFESLEDCQNSCEKK